MIFIYNRWWFWANTIFLLYINFFFECFNGFLSDIEFMNGVFTMNFILNCSVFPFQFNCCIDWVYKSYCIGCSIIVSLNQWCCKIIFLLDTIPIFIGHNFNPFEIITEWIMNCFLRNFNIQKFFNRRIFKSIVWKCIIETYKLATIDNFSTCW